MSILLVAGSILIGYCYHVDNHAPKHKVKRFTPLRDQLDQAIKEENYEKAAVIRDEMSKYNLI